MANMNFGVNILPKANNTYTLGNSDYKWNIFANTLNGQTILSDVQVNSTSIVNNGIASIPIATANDFSGYRLVQINTSNGITIASDNCLSIVRAQESDAKAGNNAYKVCTPYWEHYYTFYGLAKAAGDSTQSASSNTVGTYTNEAKAAIQSMLGISSIDVQINGTSIVSNGVANIPLANDSTYGVIKTTQSYGITVVSDGILRTVQASDSQIKGGTNGWLMVPIAKQHQSVFYGLAKAAGDSTQVSSSNAVGTYTDSAKTAIKNMLGITAMTGATSSTAGTAGLIPAPSAGDEGKFLKGDGTWGTVGSSGSSVTPISFSIATTDWTLSSGVYTASVINSAITSNSLEIITYNNSIKSLQSDIDTTKDTTTNSIIFSVNTVPSATISGTIYLFTGAVLADTKLNSNQGANNAGKYMKVGADGLLVPDTISIDALPAVTSSDNGKFLCVVNGAWAAVTMQEWQGGSY